MDGAGGAGPVVLIVWLPGDRFPDLDDGLLRRTAARGIRLHLVVPAVPPEGEAARWATSEHREDGGGLEGVGFRLARTRLERGLKRVAAYGFTADGEVGDPDPLRATLDALARLDVAAILVPPAGSGRFARHGRGRARLVRRLQRETTIPVRDLVTTGN